MDMRTIALLTELAHADAPARKRAGLGVKQDLPWSAAARVALVVLISATLTAAPVFFWTVWLRCR